MLCTEGWINKKKNGRRERQINIIFSRIENKSSKQICSHTLASVSKVIQV